MFQRRRSLLNSLIVTALVLISGLMAQAQATYTFTDLGVINPSTAYASGLGINNAGQILLQSRPVVGTARVYRITPTTDGSGHPVWYTDSNNDGINDLLQLLPLPGGFTFNYAYGGAINASGQATCVALAATNTVPQDAIVWSTSDIPTVLTSTKVTSNGLGINDGGDVAGSYWDYKKGNRPPNPYLWQYANGTYTAVQLSTAEGYATTVNNSRQVLGIAGGTFLWLPAAAYGLSQGFHIMNGINVTSGKNLNNSGLISGTLAANNHLCLWAPPAGGTAYGLNNGLNDLGSGAFAFIWPSGLNNPLAGQPLQVVGMAQDAANNQFAFCWDSATRAITNLNGVTVNLPAGWTLKSANGLNDLGEIVGTGTYNGATRAFLLTPQ